MQTLLFFERPNSPNGFLFRQLLLLNFGILLLQLHFSYKSLTYFAKCIRGASMKKKTLMIFFSIFTESVSNIVPPSKEIAVDKRFQTTTKRPTPTTTLAAQTECLTKNGQKCILPFTFEGEAQEGCVHRWKDTAAWCAFKVDESGSFIDDKSSWDYCDESCPLAPQQKDDEFWNF